MATKSKKRTAMDQASSAPSSQPRRESRALAASSRGLDTSIGIVVCIPSFRRPEHLRKTLETLVAQSIVRRFAVVIVDNDANKCEAVPVATEFLSAGKLSGLCVVEPRQGNVHAINAAFETARETFPSAEHFLMIDDDELASPGWLQTMVQAAESTGADIVGGPVFPHFDDAQKRGLRRHPAFAPAYDSTGPVPVIYGSGNCLIRRAVFERMQAPTFDLRFNLLGGGDTDFFWRCMKAGLKFHWTAEAVIDETVPPVRTSLRWLVLRGLRIGAINYHVQRKVAPNRWSRAALTLKMLAALPMSLPRAFGLALSADRAVIAMHPMTVAAGSALAAIGIEPQPYKASKIAS